MFNFSNHTKSFLAVMLIAFTSVMTAYYLTAQLNRAYTENYYNGTSQDVYSHNQDRQRGDAVVWTEYSDKRTGISFKYPETWAVKTFKEKDKPNGWYVIGLDPGEGAEMVRIYVSSHGFYALEGLPLKEVNISGKKAVNVADMLVGFQNGQNYFTFDLGGNVEFEPEFKTMLSQVAFRD